MVIPVHIWAYALRIWLAAIVALGAAFWLQLGGASSAAVTVAILAQPTRGAALAKAANRIAATLRGATMSVVIAGLFPGERIGMLGALERFSVDVNRNSKGVPKSAQIRFGLL